MLGDIYHGDQTTTADVVSGATDSELSASAAATVANGNAEAPVYVFTANYSFVWQGQTLSFRSGFPYQLDAALLAALGKQNAPIVAA
jgi:hypothetical protein